MTDEVNIKSHKVMSMEPEKRNRIINASMKEFCGGFKNASTDAIVREAGVSKGLLFHYFGSKEKLFEFILWYSYDLIMTEFVGLTNFEQADILDRIWQATLLKIDLSYKYPTLFGFIAAAYNSETDNVPEVFAKFLKTAQTNMRSKLLEGINTSLFKDGIDITKAVNIIWWTMLGYSNSQINSAMKLEDHQREYGRYLKELKEYFDILRLSLYKQS